MLVLTADESDGCGGCTCGFGAPALCSSSRLSLGWGSDGSRPEYKQGLPPSLTCQAKNFLQLIENPIG